MFKNRLTSRNKLSKHDLEKNKWFIYRYEMMIILFLAVVAAILNQIPNWYVRPLADGTIDPILSYPLRDSIVYSSFSIILVIAIAIFIGIYTETGKFAGKYGSTIFVLVPSFVWLLSDRSDNRIEDILDTSKFLGTVIFWSLIGIASFYLLLLLFKITAHKFLLARKSKLRVEFFTNIINRLLLVFVNILIVLMLGYTLINYGILSLHLADNTPEQIKADPSIGTHNLHSEGFTTYIAVVAIFFAMLMITIGLTNIFIDNSTESHIIDGEIDINQIDNLLVDDDSVIESDEQKPEGGSYG